MCNVWCNALFYIIRLIQNRKNSRKDDEGTVMKEKRRKTDTFLIKIIEKQNTTWQGKVTWIEEQREQYFKSALELLKLIDGAMEQNQNIEGGSHEK